MKPNIHPENYRTVLFFDSSANEGWLIRSCAPTSNTMQWKDGKEYPVVKIHISSASHPFFTGEEKIIDTEGRVDRFTAKLKAAKAHRQELAKKLEDAKAKQAKADAKTKVDQRAGS